MSIYELPKATGWTDALIHNLETSKFEEVNLDKKPHETRTDKIGRLFNTIRLKITGIWGTRDEKATFKAERASIDNYKSKLNDLITHLSKTPLTNPEWAELVGKQAESPTSPQDPYNERDARATALPQKIQDFYDALRARVEQIAGSDNQAPQDVQYQAALIRAGLQEVADKINENNTAHTIVKKSKIGEWWNLIVSREILNYTRSNLHKEISPDEFLATGENPKDYLNKKLSLYNAAIETNPSFQGLKDPESFEELQTNVMEEVQQERGREFQLKINQLQSKENIQARIEKRTPDLTDKIQTKEKRFATIETRIKDLQIEKDSQQEKITLKYNELEKEINKITDDPEVIDYIRDEIESYRRLNEIRETLNPMTENNDYISSIINNYLPDSTGAKKEIVDALKESSDDTHLDTVADDINEYFKETQVENLLETDDRTRIIDRAIVKAKTEELPSLREKIERLEKAQQQALTTQKQKEDYSASLTTQIQQNEKNQTEDFALLKANTEEFDANKEKFAKLVVDESELAKANDDDFLSITAKARNSTLLRERIKNLEAQKLLDNALLEDNNKLIESLKENSMQIGIEKSNAVELQERTKNILIKLTNLQGLLVENEDLNNSKYEELVRKQNLININTKDQETLEEELITLKTKRDQVESIVRERIAEEIASLKPFASAPLSPVPQVDEPDSPEIVNDSNGTWNWDRTESFSGESFSESY